jgi:hypothetical protein
MDGTHVPIHKPSVEGTKYINRKGFTSINVLGVVDHKERFTYLRIGDPGIWIKVHLLELLAAC